MDSKDILKYGHLTVTGSAENVPYAEWETPNVCGVWSVKDIIGHLASFEHMLLDITNQILGDGPTPTLERFLSSHQGFNDNEVARRQGMTPAEVWAEYEITCVDARTRVAEIPLEIQRRKGILPWYGPEYDLEDFLVYTFYGHKREHTSQINVFRDKLAQKS